MLLKKAIEMFETYMGNIERSEATIRIYLSRLNAMCRFVEQKKNGMLYLQDLTVEDMEAFLLHLKERGIAAVSRNKVVYMFKSFYNFCYKKRLVDRNFGQELEDIAFEKKERGYLSEEELWELVVAINNRLVQLVARMLAFTGMRIGECLNLTLEEVHLQEGYVHLKNTKGKRERLIPINEEFLPYLVDYVNEWRNSPKSNNFFATKHTGGLTIWAVNKVLHQTTKRLGWSKVVTCHTFRHSFASLLCKKKVDLPSIQKLLGHANLSITGVYLHSNMDDLKSAVNSL